MEIDFRILADGIDVTSAFQDRLISMTITDEAGSKSDMAQIRVDNREFKVALPATGAALEIAMGFTGNLVSMGRFVVDELSGDFDPATLTIDAKAADMLGGIRARKTRDWPKPSVGDIVNKIAADHDLTPVISDSLKSKSFEYLAQTSESDLNFLTRVARDLDAVAKPAGGALVFVKRGEAKAGDGSDLPVFSFHLSDINRGTFHIKGRGRYGSVIAEWAELGSATVQKVQVGGKQPQLELRHRQNSAEEAQRAAQSALDRAMRASGTIDITLGGFRGDLMAEAKIDLRGVNPELEGEWLVTRVTHRLANTLITSFEAERDNEKAQS